MTNANTDPFIVGLRKVIKTTAPSQEKFAEGVTSKVNLSNVLRGHSGTSLKMREKLARKAGMTVEEVISVGKRSTLPGITSGVDFGADPLNTFGKVAEMSATEILNKVGGLNLDIAEGLVKHTRTTTAVVTTLTAQRDALISLLHQEQAVLNAITDRVKVVDTDLKIVYCNRATTEELQQVVGDSCTEEACALCAEECIAKKVFSSGKSETAFYENDGVYENRVAYPLFSQSGIVNRVVIITRQAQTLFDKLTEMGWTPPVQN